MKLMKTASGKQTIKMSKSEWQSIGKTAGWLGDTKEKFNKYISNLFKSPQTNFIDTGLMALENLTQNASPEIKNQLMNISNEIRMANDFTAKMEIIEKARTQLTQLKSNPTLQKSAGPIRNKQYWKDRRKLYPSNKKTKERQEAMGEAIEDISILSYKAAEAASIKANTEIQHLANKEIAGIKGNTAIASVDIALQLLSVMFVGLSGVSQAFSYFSQYTSSIS